ncbi:hypothetical protein POSPLADRAFT_1044159 [Postia placenta MAD-698-R-SB12]|uniref:Uncharacterized protein n=1 Tax=Postia placenta MAD-698-R-SB12 TaxID=670580 RepID=A0A1X6N7T5_9APHY|nr:hypothetical protein POSPLADRAFT_1044159 [Postia placenta MAD-698-R-SB12]OSX64671.1 hypothetical protein POSPLADRAFT_1044159 [Postia placenta MAD-698-R-SB12]
MSSRRAALVTGAAQGIGRAAALRLARDGLDVAVSDLEHKAADVEQLVNEIRGYRRNSVAVYGDVSSEEAVVALVDQTVSELGSLDVVVANAGIFEAESILTSEYTWQRVMDVNAKSAFLCIKHAANMMVKQGKGGRIIVASSLAGKQGAANVGAYCASKFAVRGLVQASAAELKQHKITVNAYAPGFITTPMRTRRSPVSNTALEIASLSHIMTGLDRSALPTQGTPEEVAGLVSYWASEEAGYVTGQTWAIDGGTYFD